jgi:hypothetical protein
MNYSKFLSLGLFVFLAIASKDVFAGGFKITNKTDKRVKIEWSMAGMGIGTHKNDTTQMIIEPYGYGTQFSLNDYIDVHISESNGRSMTAANDVVFRGNDGKKYEKFSTNIFFWDVDIVNK